MFNSAEMDKFLEKLTLPKLIQEKKRGKLNRSIVIKLNLRGKKNTFNKKTKDLMPSLVNSIIRSKSKNIQIHLESRRNSS